MISISSKIFVAISLPICYYDFCINFVVFQLKPRKVGNNEKVMVEI